MAYKSYNSPYQVGQITPYKLSRSKIELFSQCQRCFWLGERMKIKRPSGPPFQINKAIDELFKKEFDSYRVKKLPHPLMIEYKIDAVPYINKDLDKWRENFVGVQTLHEPTNLLIFGAVDDVWINKNDELIVVDYKATSKKTDVNLDAEWQIGYKRQLEIYQWLLRQNGFKVSDTGYFVYTNGNAEAEEFGDKLEFTTKVIPYKGSDSWVDDIIKDMKNCLDGDMPAVGVAAMGGECDFCSYARSRTELAIEAIRKNKK